MVNVEILQFTPQNILYPTLTYPTQNYRIYPNLTSNNLTKSNLSFTYTYLIQHNLTLPYLTNLT